MTKDELEAIQERAGKATPGPWTARVSRASKNLNIPNHVVRLFVDEKGRRCTSFICECHGAMCNNKEDSEFIAHTRTDTPALLTYVAAQREEINRLKRLLDVYKENMARARAEMEKK